MDSSSADIDPQLELPGHLDGEEEPGDNPEEEVEHRGDHEHQHGAVEGALVDDGKVVEEWPVADGQGDEGAHGGGVGEVHPEAGLPLCQLDGLLLPLLGGAGGEGDRRRPGLP